ncbi:nuclease [Emiliania huxleyi virus PS401]|nr:nuclease [Emiliania huxleyi virus PS401]
MDPITLMICAVLLAVDGDTVKCDGQNLRPMGDGAPFVSGFDAPEIGRFADCPEEHRLGVRTFARMSELLQLPGLVVEESREIDRFGRPLVVLRLPDGRTLGSILIAEGLAVEWTPDYRASWCGWSAR